ncbi:hypothetical protein [Maridesulfovibrio sp.]|uniref:hypothetical protein n=1 Tax=Maridesulfovibrio sp. TaxID=2795000 RepID=UPI0039EF1664
MPNRHRLGGHIQSGTRLAAGCVPTLSIYSKRFLFIVLGDGYVEFFIQHAVLYYFAFGGA